MLYSELKEQILSLGFETSGVFSDTLYPKLFRDGINKALSFVNVEFPVIERYDISLDGTGTGFYEIDFADLSDFDSLLNATIKKEVNGRSQILPFSDFVVEQDTVVKVSETVDGDVTFFYRKRITPITLSTLDTATITVNLKAEQLLPLLACYYIWLDDDPEKAAKWRNEYEDMKQIVLNNTQQPKTYVFSGGFR